MLNPPADAPSVLQNSAPATRLRSPAAEAHAALLEGRIAMVRGDLDAAEAALRRALSHAKAAEGPGQVAAAYRQMAELAGLRGDAAAATNALQRALAAVELGGDRASQAEVMVELGRLNEQSGKVDRARQIFEDALHLASSAKSADAVAGAAGELGRLLGNQGDIDGALRYYKQAAETLIKLPDGGDHEAAALSYLAMAELEELRRDLRAAAGWLELAWPLDEATPATRLRIGGRLGWALLLLRRRADALAVLEGTRQLLKSYGNSQALAGFDRYLDELRGWPEGGAGLGWALLRHGERRAAEGVLALEADDQLKRSDVKGALGSLGALYWMLFDRGDMGAASRTFKRAMSLAATHPDQQRLLRRLRKQLETASNA